MGTRPGASPASPHSVALAPSCPACFQAQPWTSQQCLRDTHSPEDAAFERPDSTVPPLSAREPQTIAVLGPKMSAHPQAALPCTWRKESNVDRQPLLSPCGRIRQWSLTLGADEGGGPLGAAGSFPVWEL